MIVIGGGHRVIEQLAERFPRHIARRLDGLEHLLGELHLTGERPYRDAGASGSQPLERPGEIAALVQQVGVTGRTCARSGCSFTRRRATRSASLGWFNPSL